MKSTIQGIRHQEITVPALLKNEKEGIIVFMNEKHDGLGCGMVVGARPEEQAFVLGYYGTGWILSNFEPFGGKVILEN